MAAVSLLSYLLPYIPPKKFPLLAMLSLTVPVLLVLNILFLLYWLLRFKKHFLLSLIVVLIGFKHVRSLIEFGHDSSPKEMDDLSVMTYNVRMFNAQHWNKNDELDKDIETLILQEKPDIICFQEFWKSKEEVYNNIFPYNYKEFIKQSLGGNYGQAIYSKFPILNSGEFGFKNTGNNIIWADIKVKGETLRVYNVHLQSTGINQDLERDGISNVDKKKIAGVMSRSFVVQQTQMESLISHIQSYKGRYVICGDFNNTSFSYVYKELRKTFDLQDSFEEKGSGFGRTYEFKYFPMRIDFVLTDEEFEVKQHENYSQYYSDHFPVKVILGLHKQENSTED